MAGNGAEGLLRPITKLFSLKGCANFALLPGSPGWGGLGWGRGPASQTAQDIVVQVSWERGHFFFFGFAFL